MRLSSLHISNLRCFSDSTVVFDDYTCLVGPNGAGKSTVLTALNVFFRETANSATDTLTLSKEDFHFSDTSQPIEIEATFEDLSAEAQEDFKGYYRNGKLLVSAVAKWNDATQSAPVMQFGERLGIEAFRIYFEKEKGGAKAPELQAVYDDLRTQYPGLPVAKTKQAKEDALHEYETSHPAECKPIRSEDQFYGVSHGVNRLEKYVQWVYIPAVKDASEEEQDAKNTAIGKLLARRVHSQLNLSGPIDELKKNAIAEYQKLIDSKTDSLKSLSDALNKRFHTWAHDGANLIIDWQDTEKSVSIAPPAAQVRATELAFVGSLARFGHGLQRSFIFALLQEAAEHMNTGPRLLLGCEEPELYQHPPQARYLAGVMQQLSTQNAQLMISTHSPLFVSGRSFEHIRMVLKDSVTGAASVKQTTFDEIAETIATATGAKPAKRGGIEAKVEQEMQGPMNEMFFATVRVLVEGLEDIAYISTYLSLMDRWQEFRSHGCHLVQVQGKHHLIEGIAIAKHFGLPTMVVFDCDGDTPPDDPAKPTGRRKKQEADNKAVLALMDATGIDAFPAETLWRDNLVAWPTEIGDVVEAEIGTADLDRIKDEVRAMRGIDLPNMEKNSLFIGYVMAQAWSEGKKSKTLEKLCDQILRFAATAATTKTAAPVAVEDPVPV
jgi:predicted ATP-dependent endonuclease of OLD family